MNPFQYGILEGTLLPGYGGFRSGGLFYNPNVLGSHLFLFYAVFNFARELKQEQKNLDITLLVIMALIGYSLYLTASRTYTAAFLLFIGLYTGGPILKKVLDKKKITLKEFIFDSSGKCRDGFANKI